MRLSTSKARRRKRVTRPETRLVLPPPAADAHGSDDLLKSLIDRWLVPLLVNEFVRERALPDPKDDEGEGGELLAA